ncbi:MAG: recombinase family protein [Nitrospira sp.]|nr:recombinase family protein [Nitrospira sp.]
MQLPGNKGRKRQLVVEESEAVVVNRIMQWYLHGDRGQELGLYGIAARLNAQGILIRGRRWTKGRIYEVLTNRAYIGEHYFNKYEKRGGVVRRMKPGRNGYRLKSIPLCARESYF